MRQKGGIFQWILMKQLMQKGGSKRYKKKYLRKKKRRNKKILGKQKGGGLVRLPSKRQMDNTSCSIM